MGWDLVAGRSRVPGPATGTTAFLMGAAFAMVSSVSVPSNNTSGAGAGQRRAVRRRPADPPSQTDQVDREAGGLVRIQKVLSRAGVASRRHAEAMIVAGRVRVNGQVADQLGARVDPDRDEVTVDGRRVSLSVDQAYLALNKPAGYVATANDPEGRPTVMELVPPVPGLFTVGRLDYHSEGLLLLTTDGEWGQRVTHPRYGST